MPPNKCGSNLLVRRQRRWGDGWKESFFYQSHPHVFIRNIAHRTLLQIANQTNHRHHTVWPPAACYFYFQNYRHLLSFPCNLWLSSVNAQSCPFALYTKEQNSIVAEDWSRWQLTIPIFVPHTNSLPLSLNIYHYHYYWYHSSAFTLTASNNHSHPIKPNIVHDTHSTRSPTTKVPRRAGRLNIDPGHLGPAARGQAARRHYVLQDILCRQHAVGHGVLPGYNQWPKCTGLYHGPVAEVDRLPDLDSGWNFCGGWADHGLHYCPHRRRWY